MHHTTTQSTGREKDVSRSAKLKLIQIINFFRNERQKWNGVRRGNDNLYQKRSEKSTNILSYYCLYFTCKERGDVKRRYYDDDEKYTFAIHTLNWEYMYVNENGRRWWNWKIKLNIPHSTSGAFIRQNKNGAKGNFDENGLVSADYSHS